MCANHALNLSKDFGRMRRLLASIAGALALTIALNGCATYVDIPKTARNKNSDIFPRLTDFITEFEEHRTAHVQDTRNREARARSILNIAMLGAGLGAGTAAIYDAHRDVVLGFGLAGVTAYSGSSLFFSPVRTQLFNAANGALACIANTADTVVATGHDGMARLASIEELKVQAVGKASDIRNAMKGKTEDGLTEAGKSIVANAKKAVTDADTAELRLTTLQANFAAFKGSDALLESRARTAARSIIQNLNKELEKAEPSPERVYETALALGGLSIGFTDRVVADTAGRTEDGLDTPGPLSVVEANPYSEEELDLLNKQTDMLNTLLQTMAAQMDSVESSVKAAINGMGELATACAFHPVQLADLSLDPASVTVAKDVDVRVRVLGGKPPYLANWKTSPPGNSVGFALVGDTIIVSGKSGIDAGEYDIVVTDSLAAKGAATLKVKTLKP